MTVGIDNPVNANHIGLEILVKSSVVSRSTKRTDIGGAGDKRKW
jgi:hypothetical protein